MADWQTKSSKIVYQNPWMIVHEDEVVTPNGSDGLYGWTESTDDSAYIVAIDANDKIQLIQQYRYTLKDICWEIPAGRVPRDEDIMEGARRELEEETGLKAADLILLGAFFSAPGVTTLSSKVFLARGLTKVSDTLDQDDGILQTKAVNKQEFDDMVLRGEIRCAGSMAAVSMAYTYLSRRS